MAITKERTEEIVIGDLQEAQHLFERDSSYLKIIGEHYGADISGRGNMIRIKGEEEAVENSLHVIARIRHMIASRIRLAERQVRLVMSLIDQGKENLLQEMEDDIINFTKNGAPIRPRTLGQALCGHDPQELHHVRHRACRYGQDVPRRGTGCFCSSES